MLEWISSAVSGYERALLVGSFAVISIWLYIKANVTRSIILIFSVSILLVLITAEEINLAALHGLANKTRAAVLP